jgi:hypothetical protein
MIIERGRPGEHPKGTSDHVTSRGTPTGDVISGQKTLIGRDPYFRLRMRAPTLPREPLGGHVTFDDITSGEKAGVT